MLDRVSVVSKLLRRQRTGYPQRILDITIEDLRLCESDSQSFFGRDVAGDVVRHEACCLTTLAV